MKDTRELLREAGVFDVFGREVRSGKTGPTQVREAEEGFTLYGYAAVFDVETVIAGYFREKIAKGAFKKTLKDGADVRHLFNHDPSQVLARTKSGTLVLAEDDEGLAFEVSLNPDDPDAIRVVEKVRRGDVDQASFAFRVIREEWVEPEGPRDLPLRIIKEAALFDTSTVTYPAYEAATSLVRSAGLEVLRNAMHLSAEELAAALSSLVSGTPAPDDVAPILRSAGEALAEAAEARDPDRSVGDHNHAIGVAPGSVNLTVRVGASSSADDDDERAAEKALADEDALERESEQLRLRHRLRTRAAT